LHAALPFLDPPPGDVLDLTLAAPRFDALPATAAKLPLAERGHPLPLGLPDLREAIAAKLHRENRLTTNPVDELIITQGATGALGLVLDTFLQPGGRVLVFDPGYYGHAWAVTQREGRLLRVPAVGDDKGRLRFSLSRLVTGMKSAKLLLLNTPHNPTGAVIDPEDLELIAWYADREDILLFSDEVYERYQFDGPFVSIGSFPKAAARTFTANSLSKSHALAAYRVGWLAGPRHLIRHCGVTALLQQHTVPTLCQHLALAALQVPYAAFQAIRQEFQARRQFVQECLKAMGLNASWPAGAYYVWLSVQGLQLTGREFAERLLQEHQVLTVPGDLFGPGSGNFVRLSFALEDEARLREAFDRLAIFVRHLAPVAQPALPKP
jgi:aspartate/methionine/tyrosine aminotransferase